MEQYEPNFQDPAGELHAEIIRRDARVHRQSQREMARIFADRGWPTGRIAEALEIDLQTLDRMLAVDGYHRCTECAYRHHAQCVGEIVAADAKFRACECPECCV